MDMKSKKGVAEFLYSEGLFGVVRRGAGGGRGADLTAKSAASIHLVIDCKMPCWLPTTLTAALAYSRFLIFVVVVVVFGCLGSSLLRAGFSLIAASGGYSSLRCAGFSLRWLLLLQSTGSRHTGFSSCGAWTQ